MNGILLVGVGGFFGAIARYLVGIRLRSTVATTLAVNVLGSFALGMLVGASVGDPLVLALGTGFCGAFTTFSAFAVELVGRFEAGQRRLAAAYGLGMAVTAIIAVFVGGWFAIVLL